MIYNEKREGNPRMDPRRMQSLWEDRQRSTWRYYCPHCRAERMLPYSPRPGTPRHALQIGLTAVVFMLATWPWLGFKGIVSFVPFWMIFEFFYRTKMRAALACTRCGFDPFLYLTDVKRARIQVEETVKRHREKTAPVAEIAASDRAESEEVEAPGQA